VSARTHTRRAVRAQAAVAACALAAATAAPAEAPVVGGSVPSVLTLSLSQPSGFSPAPETSAQRRGNRSSRLYTTAIEVAVTATETPTRLSIADGEATGGRRRGRLVRGAAALSPALQAAAGPGAYRSLDRGVDPQLAQWSQPLTEQTATVRVRQAYRGSAGGLRRYHKLLLITVTAGGP
jgi:hypothetical protein